LEQIKIRENAPQQQQCVAIGRAGVDLDGLGMSYGEQGWAFRSITLYAF
jgi:hypothetical protein